MAEYKYKFDLYFGGFSGNSLSRPLYQGDGCVLVIVSTATTSTEAYNKAAATTRIPGGSDGVYQISGRTGTTTYQIISTGLTCWCSVVVIRPGGVWYATNAQQLSQYERMSFSIPTLTLSTPNLYLTETSMWKMVSNQGDPYYKRLALSEWNISGASGQNFCKISSYSTYWSIRTADTVSRMSVSQYGKRYAAINKLYFDMPVWNNVASITEYTKFGFNVTVPNSNLDIYVYSEVGLTFDLHLYGLIEKDGVWEEFAVANTIVVSPQSLTFETTARSTSPLLEGYSILGASITTRDYASHDYEVFFFENSDTVLHHVIGQSSYSWDYPYPQQQAEDYMYSDITVRRIEVDFYS